VAPGWHRLSSEALEWHGLVLAEGPNRLAETSPGLPGVYGLDVVIS
jgi:hypothetical protein